MNWGKWIIVAFIFFAAFIATLVTVCMRQDVSLVSKDYYANELAYQDQIQRINNANRLTQKPSIHKSGNFLLVEFHQAKEMEKGKLTLFNPSDPAKDKIYALSTSVEEQLLIPLEDIKPGMYRAQLEWAMDGKEYFTETVITI